MKTLLLVLLVGCSSPSSPAQLDAAYDAVCHRSGIRREAGDPDEMIDTTFAVSMSVESGTIVLSDDCAVAIVGYDGSDFDLQPVDCDGFLVEDGHGSTVDGFVFDMSVTWTGSGWSEEFTTSCSLTRSE